MRVQRSNVQRQRAMQKEKKRLTREEAAAGAAAAAAEAPQRRPARATDRNRSVAEPGL
jgi:hypothetical protein